VITLLYADISQVAEVFRIRSENQGRARTNCFRIALQGSQECVKFRIGSERITIDTRSFGIGLAADDFCLPVGFRANFGELALGVAVDLGRFALMKRSDLLRKLRQVGGTALLGGILVYYIRPLSLFQRFDLHTQVISWDNKWIYLEHRILRGDTLHARAIARVLGRDREGNMPTARLLEMLGSPDVVPPQPVPEAFRK